MLGKTPVGPDSAHVTLMASSDGLVSLVMGFRRWASSWCSMSCMTLYICVRVRTGTDLAMYPIALCLGMFSRNVLAVGSNECMSANSLIVSVLGPSLSSIHCPPLVQVLAQCDVRVGMGKSGS